LGGGTGCPGKAGPQRVDGKKIIGKGVERGKLYHVRQKKTYVPKKKERASPLLPGARKSQAREERKWARNGNEEDALLLT